jgi:hypothetical protein
MRRIEINVFLACVLMLGAWMALGPERYVHRAEIADLFRRG